MDFFDVGFFFRLGATRQIAPRMYCDICEEFDLHETEDCPLQNSDVVVNVGNHKKGKVVEDRSYCDICEGMRVFLFVFW